MGYPEYRGPLVAPNRETVGSRNGFVPSPASQIGTIRRQEAAPQTRDLNPPAAARPFGAAPQGPQRDSAKINAQRSEIGSQHLSADPAASEGAQGSTKNFSGMRISLLLTHGYSTTAERDSIGHEFP
jgi:hypothetical protein